MTVEALRTPPTPLQLVDGDDRQLAGAARAIAALIVGIPFLALVAGGLVAWRWGWGLSLRDVVLAAVLYFATGHGMTVGFHRLLAHKAFTARRPLKLVLVALGSMAYEGGPVGWVANHRRHHVFSDTPKDPHSPHQAGPGLRGQLKGLWHAHVGWLFTYRGASEQRHAADLLADRDIVVMNALFPLWSVLSLALPFGLGWLLGGTLSAAFSALLWAGLVRIFLLHHVTWSVNSLCHTFGRRPFPTKDRSRNVGALSIISMGESWHNGHHAFPRSARHGVLGNQWDTSARIISVFERAGWVSDVHWPTPEALDGFAADGARRRATATYRRTTPHDTGTERIA